MKLLMALCDAMGFAVEVQSDFSEVKVDGATASQISMGYARDAVRVLKRAPSGEALQDAKGMYTSVLIEPIISFELIKR